MPPTIGPKIKNVSGKWFRATYPSLRIAYQAVDRPPAKYSKKKVFLKVEISYVRGGDAIFSAGGETFWGLSAPTSKLAESPNRMSGIILFDFRILRVLTQDF